MDFSNRSAQPQSYQSVSQAGGTAAPQPTRPKQRETRHDDGGTDRAFHFGRVVLVVVTVLLFVSLVGLIYFSQPVNQSKYLKKNDLQAVFLNSGQVYFGNIRDINSKYLVLSNIYYLQTSGTNDKNSNVSLVKLGCELHEPYDQMVINNDQVTFWENLQKDGKVAKAVSDFEKQNPNGQKCSEQTSAPNTNSGVQGSSNSAPSSSTNKSTTTPNTNTNTSTNNTSTAPKKP
jgi:hypothetical protein